MILLLNGAFGIGKTTVARAINAQLPGSRLFDPEIFGLALQRILRAVGRDVPDFQDLRLWRRLTIIGIRASRMRASHVIVPMAISNASYLTEIRSGLDRFEPDVRHRCLVAPIEVVHARLANRGAQPMRNAWEYRRAAECCALHQRAEFAVHIDASVKSVEQLARDVLA